EGVELMACSAGYGFNRSHSAAYALVTYQTGYLKHHYPHEFMAGLLSCDRDNVDNIVKFTAEARSMGLTVERPDVNESDLDFTVVAGASAPPSKKSKKLVAVGANKEIRFGLGAVKGVGSAAVEAVLAARAEGGPFTSVYDFANRVDGAKVNRRVLEAFIKSGAFDGAGKAKSVNRAQMFSVLDGALEQAAAAQRDRKSGQTSLFGLLAAAGGGAVVAAPPGVYPKAA